jgi:hypothetical protein
MRDPRLGCHHKALAGEQRANLRQQVVIATPGLLKQADTSGNLLQQA